MEDWTSPQVALGKVELELVYEVCSPPEVDSKEDLLP